MKCPHCTDVTLVMTERQGVEIDYCPQCRGVWLDRGELDKLIARDAAPAPGSAAGLSTTRPPSRF
jgi:Zn-finger nucleic acid-binding protein